MKDPIFLLTASLLNTGSGSTTPPSRSVLSSSAVQSAFQTLETDFNNDVSVGAQPTHASVGQLQDDLASIRKGTLTGTAATTAIQNDEAAILAEPGPDLDQVSQIQIRSPGGPDGHPVGRRPQTTTTTTASTPTTSTAGMTSTTNSPMATLTTAAGTTASPTELASAAGTTATAMATLTTARAPPPPRRPFRRPSRPFRRTSRPTPRAGPSRRTRRSARWRMTWMPSARGR